MERQLTLKEVIELQKRLYEQSLKEGSAFSVGDVVWYDNKKETFGTVDEIPENSETLLVMNIDGTGGNEHWGMWPVSSLVLKVD